MGFELVRTSSVADTRLVDLNNLAERRTVAAEHAENIRWNAEQLVQTSNLIGNRLQASATELSTIKFGGDDELDQTIQAVDFTQAPAGGDSPSTLPPPRSPVANDEQWRHGGDQSLPPQITAGMKQKLVALATLEMERNGQTVSRDMLNHYLDNSGTPKELSAEQIDSWLSNDTTAYTDAPPPALQINRNLADITQQAYERASTVGYTSDVDWNHALGNRRWQ